MADIRNYKCDSESDIPEMILAFVIANRCSPEDVAITEETIDGRKGKDGEE